MSKWTILNVLALLAAADTAKTLPSYIVPCSVSDPKLNDCALKSAIKALPEVLKGDKKFSLPNLVPLEISEILLSPSENLQIKLTNCKLIGLENAIIKKINFDDKNHHASFKVEIEHLNLVGDYEVNGRILILPIVGNGPANITFVGGVYEYEFDYNIEKRHGKEFIKFEKHSLEYSTSRNYFRLDNLFNGDKALGDQMNKFLDESWREVGQELYPSLKQTVGMIITSIATGYISHISFDDMFLP